VADKTVGLKLDEWRQLKQIALDRECTLSEAVKFLIERFNEEGERNGATEPESPGTDTDRKGG